MNENTKSGTKVPRVIALCGNMVIVSGLERMTFEVLRVLREHNAQVLCIVNCWDSDRIKHQAEEIGATWSVGDYYYTFWGLGWDPVKWIQAFYDIFKTSLQLLVAVWKFRPTHILVSDFHAVIRNAPALLLLRLCVGPVYLRMGNAPVDRPFYRILFRCGISPLVTRFVPNSHYVRDVLQKFGVNAAKIDVIYNALPLKRSPDVFRKTTRTPTLSGQRLIYVGQIIPEKGLDILLESLLILNRNGHSIGLDVVGDTEQWVPESYRGFRKKVEDLASSEELKSHVDFKGSRDDVLELMAASSLHVIPSLPAMYEGMPNVILEAKCAGIPSIAFRTGPMAEVISHTVDGYLCEVPRAEELAAAILWFLSDEKRLEQAGSAARKSLERFSREQFILRWCGLFEIADAEKC